MAVSYLSPHRLDEFECLEPSPLDDLIQQEENDGPCAIAVRVARHTDRNWLGHSLRDGRDGPSDDEHPYSSPEARDAMDTSWQ